MRECEAEQSTCHLEVNGSHFRSKGVLFAYLPRSGGYRPRGQLGGRSHEDKRGLWFQELQVRNNEKDFTISEIWHL